MMFWSWDKSSNKKMFCSRDKSANTLRENVSGSVKGFGSRVLPVNKPNSHERERREEWLSLDSVTDIPPDCLVDSLDDAGSCIVLLHFLEAEHRGCLKITATTIIRAPRHGNDENTLTPHSGTHCAWKTWTIWALFSSPNDFENVLGYFGTVAFYKYLAVMSFQQQKNVLKGKSFPMCQCCRCFEMNSSF